MVLLLTRNDVIEVLTMKDCMTVVEAAFAELANGTAMLPLRLTLNPENGYSLYMPAYLQGMGALGCKVVSVFRDNPKEYKIPATNGQVILQNPVNGTVICIMEAGYLTSVRAGAASGVATNLLARKQDGQVMGIYGAGIQAKMQLWAIAQVRKLAKVWVYDVNKEDAKKFAVNMTKLCGVEVRVSEHPDFLIGSDIITTATSATKPLFDGNLIKPGTHINGIGSHKPSSRELDSEIVKRSKFVGDSREACFNEAGDWIIPFLKGHITERDFYAELGDIITNKKKGRVNNNEITLFKSNGLAIQDVATAKLVYDKAVEAGIGKQVDFL